MPRKKKAPPAPATVEDAIDEVAAEEEATKTADGSVIDGRQFLRAVGYALKACHAGEGTAHLAHMAFVGKQIVCSDGERWHVGMLPVVAAKVPFVCARSSVKELMIHLTYADRISRAKSAQWEVVLETWEEQGRDGRQKRRGVVTIKAGGMPELDVELIACEVGHIPDQWSHPVPETAKLVDGEGSNLPLRCGHFKEAMQWYRAWDKDHGVFVQRVDDSGVLRLDISSGGHPVAVAFLLPSTLPAARLVADEPLFEKLNEGHKVGQSILDLQIDRDGKAYVPPADGDSEEPKDIEDLGWTNDDEEDEIE